jgi:hypothetical protein
MIPPYISQDCQSPGEKILFSRFKEDPDTNDWVVLHSLEISKHPTQIQGEIDFVVIVPSEGVLCLEVKAGNVTRKEGIWFYGSGHLTESSTKSPFKQASEGMHAMREHVKRIDPSLKSILFISGVFFTYIDFDEVSTEWHQWQYADRSILTHFPISTCCLTILRRAHEHIKNVSSSRFWYDKNKSRPNEDQIKKLTNILRGDFEYFVSPRAIIEETEKEIIRFTEEQFFALDVLEENHRIIYKGPAGTGKTFLAIEAVRRALAAGKRTFFLCYNRLLGQWLLRQTETFAFQYPGMLTVGTLHSVLLHLSGLRPADASDRSFWSKRIPDAVMERALLGIIRVPLCDTFIIDEAQDLVTEEYLDVMDLFLEGGLAGGRWVMFGDFERQSIYFRQELLEGFEIPKVLRRRSPVHFVYPLRTNCRNTEPIAVGLELVCKLQPGYSRILRTETGIDVDINFYQTPEQQTELLIDKLKKLGRNFQPSEVAILSTREDKASCAGLLQQRNTSLRINSLRNDEENSASFGFTTIQAFKGMEAPAVILTDIEKITGGKAEALLYVGMSRARLRLIMLMHENCRSQYMKAVQDGFMSKTKRRS